MAALRDLVTGNKGGGNALAAFANDTLATAERLQDARVEHRGPPPVAAAAAHLDMLTAVETKEAVALGGDLMMPMPPHLMDAHKFGPPPPPGVHMPMPPFAMGPMPPPPPPPPPAVAEFLAQRRAAAGGFAGESVDALAADFERVALGAPADPMQRAFEAAYRPMGPHPAMMHAPPPPPPHAVAAHEAAMAMRAAHAAQAAEAEALEAAYGEVAAAQQRDWAAEFAGDDAAGDLERAHADASRGAAARDWVNEFGDAQAREAEAASGGQPGLDAGIIEKLRNSSDPKWRNSKFLKFLSRLSRGEIELKDDRVVERVPEARPADSDWAAEYAPTPPAAAAVAEPTAAQEVGARWGDEFDEAALAAQDWGAEFARAQAPQPVLDAQGNVVEGAVINEMPDFDWDRALRQAKEAQARPDPEYAFQAPNPFAEHKDPLAEGRALLAHGDLNMAVLALEAAAQRNLGDAEAWALLGGAHAENENEEAAIAALLRAVKADPYNLDALLMLGVSYTNDLDNGRALNYLQTWLKHNPDYQDLDLERRQGMVREFEEFYAGDAARGAAADNRLLADVTDMFEQAARRNANDVELFTVLGVLHHMAGDYDRAVAAFSRAIELRPSDPRLWNKLGATQANSARSDAAVKAYQRALELKPHYVRALANLAISYANQGMHEQAAATYLTTLSRNPRAEHVWGYLRISLAHLGREALVELTHRKDPELFREYFQF